MAWVSSAVGVGTALISGYQSARQNKQAKKLAMQNSFPNQDTPQAVKEAEQMAANEANIGLPGATLGQARKQIDRSAATALGRARDSGSALAAIPYIQQQTNDANQNIDVADANARIQNRAKLMNQKNIVGGYQQGNFDWNNKQRYMDNAAAIRGLFGASGANLNSALDRGISAAGMFANNYGGNGLFGNNKGVKIGKPPSWVEGYEDPNLSAPPY